MVARVTVVSTRYLDAVARFRSNASPNLPNFWSLSNYLPSVEGASGGTEMPGRAVWPLSRRTTSTAGHVVPGRQSPPSFKHV
jgi:hypothetical protein